MDRPFAKEPPEQSGGSFASRPRCLAIRLIFAGAKSCACRSLVESEGNFYNRVLVSLKDQRECFGGLKVHAVNLKPAPYNAVRYIGEAAGHAAVQFAVRFRVGAVRRSYTMVCVVAEGFC